MIRRILLVLLGLGLFAIQSPAELSYTKVSATSSAQTIPINAQTLVVVNDGSNEIYVRVFWEGETAAAATTAYAEIKNGESFSFTKELGVASINIVCASGETASVRLFYW